MGLRLRKSFGSKGFRVTISKSGVGYSVGGKGFRVTKKANGNIQTTASIPNTGISYVDETSSKTSKTQSAATKNNAELQKFSLKLNLIMWSIGAGIIIVILIALICYYCQTAQHNKWVEQEKLNHTWETDFDFQGTTNVTCDYKASEGGYRYTIKSSITNQSGYSVSVYGIYFKFYDKNNELITTYDTGYIGYLQNGETREYTKLSTEYFATPPTTCTCYYVNYSLDIK